MTEPATRAAEAVGPRIITLRRDDTCGCGRAVPAGERAGWDRVARTVTCRRCLGVDEVDEVDEVEEVEEVVAVRDVPGGSLQRTYERRSAAREARVRERFPRIGGLLLRILPEPQTTTAFRQGAEGERAVAERLRASCGQDIPLLLNRRLGPGSRHGDIDVLAIAPTGVHVIDVKRYASAPVRVRSGRLLVGGRDRTAVLDSVERQLTAVSAALRSLPQAGGIPLSAALCFVDADLPIFGTPRVRGIPLLGIRATAKRITAPGPLTPELRDRLRTHLDRLLPPA